MTTIDGNELTIRIGPDEGNATLPALIRVLADTLAILRELDVRLSSGGKKTLRWEVVAASMNSPLTLTIEGKPLATKREQHNTNVADKYIVGFKQIKSGVKPPAYFSPQVIQKAKELAKAETGGAGNIVYSGAGSETVEVTPDFADKAQSILDRTHEFTHTTLEGRLETLDLHEKCAFGIYNTLTKDFITCNFDESMLPDVIAAVRRKVAVTGRAKLNRRTGKPVSIRVDAMRVFRSKDQLPKFNPGEYINITGDMDPTEYIRRARDAE
jgi:hypothetical protein